MKALYPNYDTAKEILNMPANLTILEDVLAEIVNGFMNSWLIYQLHFETDTNLLTLNKNMNLANDTVWNQKGYTEPYDMTLDTLIEEVAIGMDYRRIEEEALKV